MPYLWSAEPIEGDHPGVALTRLGETVGRLTERKAEALARDLLAAALPGEEDPR